MSTLTVHLIPLRPAVRSDAPVSLDVLLQIIPHAPAAAVAQRPPLNVALVLDRSGSMAGEKIEFARQAAEQIVQQLLSEDRVSVTVFDHEVQTIVPSQLALDKPNILRRIRDIAIGGTTALHAGWRRGGHQVQEFLRPDGLNRVLLLTDGQANVGLTVPDAIATDVKQLATQGVSTTTLGVGRDYNEDLLEAMARSGDGNYYFIASPTAMLDIFQTELHGLVATVGTGVRLGLEPLAGAIVADVRNDLPHDPEGRLQLSNLTGGLPTNVVVQLNIPPQSGQTELLRLRLNWTDPKEGPRHQVLTLTLPAVTESAWNELQPAVAVQEQVAVLLAARCKREINRCLERHDLAGARNWLDRAAELIAGLPDSPLIADERREQARLLQMLEHQDIPTSAKAAKYQMYRRQSSRPETPYE